jgi:hypothetical protein
MRKLSSNIRSILRVELIRIKKTTTEDLFLYRARVMNRLHDLRTGITGYGSNFKYSLAIDGVKVFFYKLGFCGSHRLAGTVISLACVHIMFTVLQRTDIFMRKLSSNIRSILRVELIRIKKTTTEDLFLYRASNAVQNIISCFAKNDHRNSQQNVCVAASQPGCGLL